MSDATQTLHRVTSADGTSIAYDRFGNGAPVVLVSGGSTDRMANAGLAAVLAGNFTVFLLFFGIAALEAFQTRNWIKAAFWLAIGIVFLSADNLKKHNT